jgi:hypothetical protein
MSKLKNKPVEESWVEKIQRELHEREARLNYEFAHEWVNRLAAEREARKQRSAKKAKTSKVPKTTKKTK